ncbi:MAG: PA0069 family radical SAM protein [Planctomycetota bacterium]|nr:PA0069 family radical SAM protein [Planctomycetota bacterium]
MPRPSSNPPNPWESTNVEWLGPPPEAKLEVYEERAKTVLSRNDSPDVPFTWSVNPYRGCYHACAYCYARPTHQYIGFGAGTDFDRRIVVKTNAPECLRRELSRRGWKGEPVTFSGVTDCYQPLEASYELTRRCLEVCLELENPVAIITKSALVRRDADLIAELHRRAGAGVFVSIPFADDAVGRRIEPAASSTAQRFATVRALASRGIPTGIAIAPVIPGLNDSDIPALLERAAAAGAERAFLILLRLPAEVLPVFRERLVEAFPERASKVFSALREMRGGRLDASAYGERMRGHGPRWEAIRRLFEIHCDRLGLSHGDAAQELGAPEVHARPRQGTLFET